VLRGGQKTLAQLRGVGTQREYDKGQNGSLVLVLKGLGGGKAPSSMHMLMTSPSKPDESTSATAAAGR
jgi:hypothetical protein